MSLPFYLQVDQSRMQEAKVTGNKVIINPINNFSCLIEWSASGKLNMAGTKDIVKDHNGMK